MKNKIKVIESNQPLKDIVIDACFDIKANEMVVLDLRHIEEAVADYFIICHAESSTQVNAIANSVIEKVKNKTHQIPISREGMRNAEWVLVDYGDVVAHIFIKERRYFYQLEELWSDAKIERVKEDDFYKLERKEKKSNARSRKKTI